MRTKGCPGVDADRGEEHCKAEVSKNDICRQRHGPEHRASAAQFPENKRNDQRSASDAERHDAHTRNGNWNKAKENAKDHPDPKRHVAEFCGRLDGVAEMAADFFLSLGRRQHADPVAEFQHQVGCRHQVRVIAPNVQNVGGIAGGHRKAGEGNSDHVRLSDEDPDVVEVRAIARQPTRLQFAKLCGRLCNSLFALRDNEDRVARGQDSIVCRHEVAVAFANHRDLDVAQRFLSQLVDLPAGKAFADGDFPHMKPLYLCREFRLHDSVS